MSNEAIITNAAGLYTTLVFGDHATATVPATAANVLYGSNVDVVGQFDPGALATDAFWQSVKVDFGATRAPLYRCDACIDFTGAAATVAETIDFYWAASSSSVAANGNATDITGLDATYVENASLLAQLQYIGSLTCSADTVVKGHVGFLVPSLRYGSLVVGNKNTTAFDATPVETHIVLTPVSYGT
jgi:hypothetical protein